jgi:hypothetical protein
MTIAKIGDDYFGPYYRPYDLNKPALYIPPGGGSVVDYNGNSWTVPPLEVGHSYYWKVKVQSVATGDSIKSPWSWRESYDVMPGFKVAVPYPGVQLLSPSNGCLSCPASPAFSWSPYQGAVKYKLVLAKDAGMKQVVLEATTITSAHECEAQLENDSAYYWRIQAIDNNNQPLSEWSATFCFSTTPFTDPAQTPETAETTPLWIWLTIAIGMIMVIITIILIYKTGGSSY